MFLKDCFEKIDFEKKSADDNKSVKNYPACKELKGISSGKPHYKWVDEESSFVYCMLGNFACFFLSSADIFQNKLFQKVLLGSNTLDPDQARQNIRPDLGPNCLQRLSADGKM